MACNVACQSLGLFSAGFLHQYDDELIHSVKNLMQGIGETNYLYLLFLGEGNKFNTDYCQKYQDI